MLRLLTHFYDYAEIYAVAFTWIAAPLFFVAMFQVLRKSGVLVIESTIEMEPKPEPTAEASPESAPKDEKVTDGAA